MMRKKLLKAAALMLGVTLFAGTAAYAAEPLRNFEQTDWDLSYLASGDADSDGNYSVAEGQQAEINSGLGAGAGTLYYNMEQNSLRLRRTSSGRARTIYVTYQPQNIDFCMDTAVIDFRYQPRMDEDFSTNQIQMIVLSSGEVKTAYDINDYSMPDEQLKNMISKIGINGKDAVILYAWGGGLYGVDADKKSVVRLADVSGNSNLNIRAAVKDGKYDLYVENGKIGILSKPVMENVTPCGELTGNTPINLRCNIYTDVSAGSETNKYIQHATFYDVSYSQKGEALTAKYEQNFDIADGYFDYTSSGYQTSDINGWYYNLNWNASASRKRIMGYAGIASGELRLGNKDFSTICANEDRMGGALNVDCKSELLGLDKVRMSVKFRSDTAGTFAQMIELASSTGYRSYSDDKWNGIYDNKAYIISDPNAAALYILNDGANYSGFYYADNDALVPLDVEYTPNKTYYLAIDVDNTAHTYDLYLQDTPVDEQSEPVKAGVGIFNKTETPLAPTTVQFLVYSDQDASSGISRSDLYADDFAIERIVSGDSYNEGRSLAFYTPDAWQQKDGILPQRGYVDIYGEDVQGNVIVAQYGGDNSLVGVEIFDAGTVGERISYDYENVNAVKLMNWDFGTMTAKSAAQTLTK